MSDMLKIINKKDNLKKEYFSSRNLSSGDMVFNEDEDGYSFYVLEKGSVAIEKSMNKEKTEFKLLAIISDGDFFGEMAVVDNVKRTARARALEDGIVYEIKKEDFFRLSKDYPQEGFEMFSLITKVSMGRLQHTSKELTLLYDAARLLTKKYKNEKEFLADIVSEIAFYFEEDWNIDAFAYNFFNDEFEKAGEDREFKSEKVFIAPKESGWIEEKAYALVSKLDDKIEAYMIFDSRKELSKTEKNNWSTIFNTISFIVSSGLGNIKAYKELLMMNKLKDGKNFI